MTSYKRLGDYIELVDERNTDLEDLPLMGLSITKEFIPSIANTIGTDMSTYKKVCRNQFGYGPVTSRNGDKITIAHFKEHDKALISQAYTPFQVNNTEKLHPEYLMMWFRRPEFDRYARFKSHGSAREVFDWDEMCSVMLPVPSIEKQREIVAEYNAVQHRIDLNNKMIEKLEATAQAIYREWFVEFNFPDENGKPYKDNGGEMIWCEELGKEIPAGWRVGSFTQVVKLSGGGTPNTTNEAFWNGNIPFFTPADISNGYYSLKTEKMITQKGLESSSTKCYPKNTIFVTARGTVGAIALAGCDMAMNQSCYALFGCYQFYSHQLALNTMEKLKTEAVGAVFGALVTKDFDSQLVLEPLSYLQKAFDKAVVSIYDSIFIKSSENQKLKEMKELLLSRLAKKELRGEEVKI